MLMLHWLVQYVQVRIQLGRNVRAFLSTHGRNITATANWSENLEKFSQAMMRIKRIISERNK